MDDTVQITPENLCFEEIFCISTVRGTDGLITIWEWIVIKSSHKTVWAAVYIQKKKKTHKSQ